MGAGGVESRIVVTEPVAWEQWGDNGQRVHNLSYEEYGLRFFFGDLLNSAVNIVNNRVLYISNC